MSNTWIKNISDFKIPFEKYINLISNYSSFIYVIDDIPFLYNNPLNCIYSKKELKECYTIVGINSSITLLPFIYKNRIKYCNMNKYICVDNKIIFLQKGIIVYKDNNHLTLSFSYSLTVYLKNCLVINSL